MQSIYPVVGKEANLILTVLLQAIGKKRTNWNQEVVLVERVMQRLPPVQYG
jgi:hypothetical protein